MRAAPLKTDALNCARGAQDIEARRPLTTVFSQQAALSITFIR
jgi:hypothetical protein